MKFIVVESYGMVSGGQNYISVCKECECCGAKTEIGFFRSRIDADTYCRLMNEQIVIVEAGKKL